MEEKRGFGKLFNPSASQYKSGESKLLFDFMESDWFWFSPKMI